MNGIVRRNYPAANLPEDLRVGLETDARVDVMITARDEPEPRTADDAGLEAFFAEIDAYRASHPERRSMEDIVAEIRALRDEWDDRVAE